MSVNVSSNHKIQTDISQKKTGLQSFHSFLDTTAVDIVTKLKFKTLSVRNGHKLKYWVFRIPSHIRVKVYSKNYNQHLVKHDDCNNSHFKTIFWNQNYIMSSFYIKTLDRFQDNVRFFIFKHILNLNYCRVFETKPHFPVFEYNPLSEQSSLS